MYRLVTAMLFFSFKMEVFRVLKAVLRVFRIYRLGFGDVFLFVVHLGMSFSDHVPKILEHYILF
jgi:hypothetical protein